MEFSGGIMKKLFLIGAMMLFATLGARAEFSVGFIYGGQTSPGGGYTATAASKTGTSHCKNIFMIVSTGDCSVRTAMKNGGIRSLAGYDVMRKNILGFQSITVKAWGN